MTSIRRFTCDDLLTYNNVNLDTLTETYNLPFYLTYLAKWPEYCQVAPDYRRQRLANKLMDSLEQVTEKFHNGYFVDLFVRKSNDVAVGMYRKLGYVVYREVLGYYSGEENAYDMRKAMARDVQRKSVVPLKRPVKPEELEFD
ncbi:acyl-CoA N-acyltransferase [Dunaliella salina]|uniref:Acyl-CoA N-acyltransferase n=1 Tax=Dunaliella salina TaxID=3046 RepID=A0ABQ7H930_DUNSA|nr:acyl-CoA N-acyltransferase [Dunaliella salina]|eukprot:KAF5843362.1 acyl-CoA N-acyltransferase [Dunaliella salina]